MKTPSSLRHAPIRSVTLLFLSLLVSSSTAALAAWQPGGSSGSIQFPVPDGSGNLISGIAAKRTPDDVVLWTVGLTSASWKSAAPDRAGGATYAGVLFGQAGVLSIVYQRVGSTGAVGPLVTICDAANDQDQPVVATDAAGNAYVVWRDQRSAPGSYQLFAQKVDPAGAPQWSANGVVVSSVGISSATLPAVVVPDESGGCIVVWQDARTGVAGPFDLYAQRLDSAGSAAWAANGIALCSAAGTQQSVRGVGDAAGGAILMWMDARSGNYDVYADRIDPAGQSLWAANGIAIASAMGDQLQPAMIPDGAGGAFMTWSDCRNCGTSLLDVYAQHVDAAGAAQWTPNGHLVTGAPAAETMPQIVSDGGTGTIVAWVAGNVRAQRLDASGAPTWEAGGVDTGLLFSGTEVLLVTDGAGGAFVGAAGWLGRILAAGEPGWVPNYRASITGVADVPGDEGGWVSVNVTKPLADGSPLVTPNISGYSLWRKRAGSAAAGPARLADDRGVLPWFARTAVTAKYSDFPPGSWDAVGYVPAVQAATYSLLAPTHADSVDPGVQDDAFVVVAHTPTAPLFIVSAIGAGHSVDNLAPGPPQGVSGRLEGAATARVQWSPNQEADLWHYAVYEGTSPDFVPSPANRIGQPTTTSLVDDTFQPGVSHYKISAVDRHGNESAFAVLGPSQVTGVSPGAVPARTYLARPSPNPFHGAMSLEYGLAREGRVSLTVYDARGRRIARLVDEVQPAGVRRVTWDGLDDSRHRTPAGVYLLRFEAGGIGASRKVVRTD